MLQKPVVIVLAIVAIAGIFAGYLFFTKSSEPDYDFVVVQRGTIAQEIIVTGRVQPALQVNLAFEKGGTVKQVYVQIAETVETGQLLIELDSSELEAQLLSQQASLEVEKAKLAELERGTRPEEIRVQEIKVANAQTALVDAGQTLLNTLEHAYTQADDAIRNKADAMYTDPRSSSPELAFTPKVLATEYQLETDRTLMEQLLVSWNAAQPSAQETSEHLETVKTFLEQLAFTLNETTTASGQTQATLDTWKTNLSTARTNIGSAISNLTAAMEKVQKAQSDLSLTQEELILKQAGAAPEEITAQVAQVKNAQALVQNYQAQIEKTMLKSPIAGIVIIQDAKIGEIVAANSILISVISEAQFQVEANIPEADIAKVNVSNSATITLDAFGRDVIFMANVTQIDPAETIIDGVPTYKVTFQFVRDDSRVKSGMTTNIEIKGATKENVLVLPQRAIIRENGEKFVRVIRGVNFEQVKVETGLQGSDGNIEIIKGISEGDKVITFFPE